MKQALFITGIGTGIGKTLISAIAVNALKADYWKPVQAGNLEYTDSDWVRDHIVNFSPIIHRESYRLTQPMSPHAAAKIDGISIDINKIIIPSNTTNALVIEGAGGLMVPLTEKDLLIDLISSSQIPVLLVSEIYLGSINHTLLSFEALKNRDIPVAGIIFNGESNPDTEQFIKSYTKLPILGRLPRFKEITAQLIAEQSELLKPAFLKAITYVA